MSVQDGSRKGEANLGVKKKKKKKTKCEHEETEIA